MTLKNHPQVNANSDCCRFAVFDCVALHPPSDMAPTLILIEYLLMHHCKRLLAVKAFFHGWRSSFDSAPILPRPAIFNFHFSNIVMVFATLT